MFILPKLNYSYDALEPYMDSATVEIHYNKHHRAYCDNFNKALEPYPALQNLSAEQIIIGLNQLEVKEEDQKKIRNHGGGFINHNMFWEIMNPQKKVDDKLVQEIEKEFESVEKFKTLFTQTSVGHFGSGWAWLVYDKKNKLKIYSLPNQDSPLTLGHKPILCLDVWEHAYYLKYQNKRVNYVNNWWNVIKLI